MGNSPPTAGFAACGHELAIARLAAERAGALIEKRWGGTLEIGFKGEVDLVSDVDLAAEAIVVESIRSEFPNDSIIAEERGAEGSGAGRVWHVDPLDGTTNFSHGFPQFCVSVAFVNDGVPTVAVVREPLRRWTFYAVRGRGAWLNGQRLQVSEVPSLDRGLLATGFPYDRRSNPNNNVDRFSHLIRRCQGIRRAGAAALDLAFTAAGWLDGFWEDRLNSWDLAAGVLLVTEAGGMVTSFDGGKLNIATGAVIASNGMFHVKLVDALAAGSNSASRPEPFQ